MNKRIKGAIMNEQTYSVGPIMKAARKFKKFNQADVATAIGCSQSALSKMEHNLLVPSAPQWFLFSRFTAIPPESLETGVIDRHSLVKMNSDEVSMGFKIPKKYRSFRAEKVRELYPFFAHYEALGKEFISTTGIDPEFFLDFDNLINYQLFLDAIDFFVKKGKGRPEDIRELVKLGQNKNYWDHYGVEWKKHHTTKDLLLEFVNSQIFFQVDFILKAEYSDEVFNLSYIPEKHAQVFAKDVSPEVSDYIKNYRKFTLENLVKRELGIVVTAQETFDGNLKPLGDKFQILS
jgi:transcriptional regulator with XRE-family HTH domain